MATRKVVCHTGIDSDVAARVCSFGVRGAGRAYGVVVFDGVAQKRREWKNGEQKMANGKRFDENALTCATRLWPLGTRISITNRSNGRSVEVIVADRIGARFAKTRIDLSRGAFSAIEDLKKGVTQVEVEVIR